MQGVLGEHSPQKPNLGDKIQCLQRFADLFLPPSFRIFVINKPYRKRRFCPAGFLNFCKTKKPLHTCGKDKRHKKRVSPLCCVSMIICWWIHTNSYYSRMAEEKEHLVSNWDEVQSVENVRYWKTSSFLIHAESHDRRAYKSSAPLIEYRKRFSNGAF